MRQPAPQRLPTGPAGALSRRCLLALAPLLQPSALPSSALDLPFGGSGPRVDLVSTPEICQGRCREQDFVVVRYIGRRADGTAFDDRYATRPLIYELSSFYLPGVDTGLDGACVGSRLKFTWPRGVDLGPAYASVLPPNAPITLELELSSIRYSLFGEKMRNASNTYWFAEQPLTLTSEADFERGHSNRGRVPEITKDNPFSIAPGEKSLISNPSSALTPLFQGFFSNPLKGDSSQ